MKNLNFASRKSPNDGAYSIILFLFILFYI